MRAIRRVALLAVTAALTATAMVALNGCGDAKSIDNRMMVFGLAFDQAPDDQYTVTALEVNPIASAAVSGGGAAGGGGGGGGQAPPSLLLTGTSASVSNAFSQIQAAAPKDLDLVALGITLFSRPVAEQNVWPLVNFLMRGGRASKLSWAIVTDGPAADVLATQPRTATNSSFRDLFLSQGSLGAEAPGILSEPIWELFRDINDSGADPVLPLIRLEQETLVFAGGALFHLGRMTGTLTYEQAAMLQIVTNRNSRGGVTVDLGQGRLAVVKMTRVKSKIEVTPGPEVRITVNALGRLVEAQESRGTPSLEEQRRVARLAEEAMTSQIHSLYRRLQESNCDAMALGSQIRAEQPLVWDALARDWPNAMRQVPLQAEVHMQIESPQL